MKLSTLIYLELYSKWRLVENRPWNFLTPIWKMLPYLPSSQIPVIMVSQTRVSAKHCRNVYSRFTASYILYMMYFIFTYWLMTFQTIYRFIRYIWCVHWIWKIPDIFFYERKLLLGDICNTTVFSFLFWKRLK